MYWVSEPKVYTRLNQDCPTYQWYEGVNYALFGVDESHVSYDMVEFGAFGCAQDSHIHVYMYQGNDQSINQILHIKLVSHDTASPEPDQLVQYKLRH